MNGGSAILDKMIHDIFHLGSGAVFNKKPYTLDEVMIWGTSEILYTVLRFSSKDGENIVCGVDIETNTILPVSSEQRELYHKILKKHKIRLIENDNSKIFAYKADYTIDDYEGVIQKIALQSNVKRALSKISMNSNHYIVTWYSFLCNKQGDAPIVSISEGEMEQLSMQALYNDTELTISLPEYDLKYQGNIVRIEKLGTEYLLYIHPYPMEILQSTQSKKTSFENIRNPFSMMDFIVNHADSDVKGVIYPNSDEKPIHNYIVVGVLKNIDINIKDCVIGNVRIGNQIDVSKTFRDSISYLEEECTTIAWVSVKSDSLYNAFSLGKKLLIVAAEFLAFMIKNDMYADWFGAVEFNNNVWDVRSHYPQISLESVFYIENCILGESITLTDKNMRIPAAIKLDDNAEYLFEYNWIENFFCKVQTENKRILRLQYALKWIVQAWDAEDSYDRVIYCSMALEFIVNGEKGSNIFDEYARKAIRTNFTKSERKALVEILIEKIELKEIDGFSESNVMELNESIKNIIRSKLTEVSFKSKLDNLINRLNIPVSKDEKELLNKARKIRNELIHGLNMASISTLEIKKLCGITSRILMYKIMSELGKE